MVIKANRSINQGRQVLVDIFLPAKAGEQTYFQEALESLTDVAAQKIGVTTQAAIKGSIGGSMKGINHDLKMEAIHENPHLGLLEALPKSMRKNPIVMMGLQSVLSKYIAGPGAAKSRDNGSSAQKSFDL